MSRSRTWLRRALGIGLPLVMLYVPFGFVESLSHGPYTRWFNRRMYERAQASGLVGAPESAIVPVLGEPSEVWHSWTMYRGSEPAPDAEPTTTYNYWSHTFAPYGQFQVHLRNGRVFGLEQLDD